MAGEELRGEVGWRDLTDCIMGRGTSMFPLYDD